MIILLPRRRPGGPRPPSWCLWLIFLMTVAVVTLALDIAASVAFDYEPLLVKLLKWLGLES